MSTKIKAKEVKAIREQMVRKQRFKCPLCRENLTYEDAVLDHCHDSGHLRKALHRSCNSAEGRIKEWAGKRSRGDDPVLFLQNTIRHWKADYSDQPIHHTHGAKKRKRRRTRTRRRNT